MTQALCAVCSTEKKPVQAQTGRHICFRCSSRLLQFVNEIEAAVLSIEKGTGGLTDVRPNGFGSKSPAWDDAIAATDYRSLPGQAMHWVVENGQWVEKPDEEVNAFARSILASLHGITRVIAEERGREWPEAIKVHTESRYLRAHLDWYATQPDVDELYADLQELHGYVRSLDTGAESVGLVRIGKCPNLLQDDYCGQTLYAPPDGDAVRCSKCGRLWERKQWLSLGRLLDSA